MPRNVHAIIALDDTGERIPDTEGGFGIRIILRQSVASREKLKRSDIVAIVERSLRRHLKRRASINAAGALSTGRSGTLG